MFHVTHPKEVEKHPAVAIADLAADTVSGHAVEQRVEGESIVAFSGLRDGKVAVESEALQLAELCAQGI